MRFFYEWFFPALWVAFFFYWQIAARGAKSNERVEPLVSRIVKEATFGLAIVILMGRGLPVPVLYRFYLPTTYWAVWFWIGAAVNVLGFGVAVWARVYLGSNWSSSVTIKRGHELITGGPYSLVRHPIYTGLLTGFLGAAIAIARVSGLVAFALVFALFWFKLRLEERWMRIQFGEVYGQYAQRVPALVPLPPKIS
ncbi:MAG: isoprenylcysteine carboxylmethyltransferase family protein [Terracidiphilus sp.]|jgi:protein-S-isoprenylcysteine O-methyltransferase Ste14